MSDSPPDDDRTIIRPPVMAPPPSTASEPPDNSSVPPEGGASAPVPAEAHASPAAANGNALPVGTCIGEFELKGVLGEGGFGIVYTAWDQSLQRRVALKEYMPAALSARTGGRTVQVRSERHRETFEAGLKSFVNEARLLAQFDHPSLVKVYRFWEANGTAYMVMPLYEGVTLKDRLRQMDGPPDEAWLLSFLAPLTEALAVIHRENCFHRDIAPDNILLLDGTDRPLLLDFGAARRVIGDLTQALTVILKPGYAPVEQYAEVPELRQGPWTDVYALAASVHFAITGRTPPASVGRLLNDSFVPLAQSAAGRYSPRFLQAIDRALQVHPMQRTESVAALRSDLGLDDGTGTAAQPGAGPTAAASAAPPAAARSGVSLPSTAATGSTVQAAAPGWRRSLLAAAALLVCGGLAGLWWMGTRPGPVAAADTGPAGIAATPSAPMPVASAAVPAPPPAAAAPSSLAVREEFDRVLNGQTSGFDVSAVPARPQLRIGKDRLAFSVNSSRAGYVSVLTLGPDGALLVLFPNSQSVDNRIKAGQTLKLPQASWALDTAEPAGAQHLLVIVSNEPRDFGALGSEREYIFQKLSTGAKGAALAASWQRATPLLLGGVKRCTSVDCDSYGASLFTVEVVR